MRLRVAVRLIAVAPLPPFRPLESRTLCTSGRARCWSRGRTGSRTARTSSGDAPISSRSTSRSGGMRSTASFGGLRGPSASASHTGPSCGTGCILSPATPSRSRSASSTRRRARHPDRLGLGRGHAIRLSTAQGDRVDKARPLLHRPQPRRRWLGSRRAPGPGQHDRGHPLGRRRLPVPDAVHRRPDPRHRSPQPGRRAHDLPAKRVPDRGRPATPGAEPVVHELVGHRPA